MGVSRRSAGFLLPLYAEDREHLDLHG